MLDYIIERTNRYIDDMPKKERKKYGQFFTSKETARFMAGLYNIPDNKSKVSILDAGAGSGILSCVLLERLEQIDSVQMVELTCYEKWCTLFHAHGHRALILSGLGNIF